MVGSEINQHKLVKNAIVLIVKNYVIRYYNK